MTSSPWARHHATTGSFMKAPSLSKSTPFSGNGKSSSATCSASSASAPVRIMTGTHSVQPVAMSVSTMVCAKAPAALTPECATKSTSTNPGGGSPQSAKVRTGTERRTAELNPARRRRPCAAAMRISDRSRSIVAGLADRSAARRSSSGASCPCRSSAGSRTGIIGANRFEQTRSDASHRRTKASVTARP